jgi:murein DD-endopeptidase MepM/ murein hydrolase activator NlpD
MSYVFPIVDWRGTTVPTHWSTGERGGTDLFAPFGAPIVAVCGGRVTYAGNEAIGGINVMIDGEDGLTYYYAHLDDRFADRADVSTGQTVRAGDRLGAVGDSGNARGKGAHLHIGIGRGISTGSGPQGGCGLNFDAVTLLQNCLRDGSTPAGLCVGGTDGAGLNLRKQPKVGAEVVKLLPEGADVQPQDRAWRPVRDPADGSAGWVADQFLVSVGGQAYRVAGTDHAGLNLRKQPKTAAAALKVLPEGTVVESQDRAWRQVRDPTDGATGWAANQFLVSC